MAFIARNIVRTSQPQELVGIDQSNPLCDGLVFQYSGKKIDDISQASPILLSDRVSNLATKAGLTELIADPTGQAKNIIFGSDVATVFSAVSSYTVELLFTPKNTSQSYHLFGAWNVASGNHVLVQINGTGMIWVAAENNGSARTRWDATGLFTQGVPQHLILSWQGGTAKAMWLNGVNRTSSLTTNSTAATVTRSSASHLNIGNYIAGSAMDVEVMIARVWNRPMWSPEIGVLARNTWQVFEPANDSIWVPDALIGGGAPVGDLAASESGLDGAAISGSLLAQGGLSVTESGVDAGAFIGVTLAQGSLAATEAASDSAALVGATLMQGALSATEASADAASITGTALAQGSISATEAGIDAAAITGSLLAQGALSATESSVDTALFGGAGVSAGGVMSATEAGADISAMTGSLLAQGLIAAAEVGNDTVYITGQVYIVGSLSAIEDGADVFVGHDASVYIPGARVGNRPAATGTRGARLQSDIRHAGIQSGTRAAR